MNKQFQSVADFEMETTYEQIVEKDIENMA